MLFTCWPWMPYSKRTDATTESSKTCSRHVGWTKFLVCARSFEHYLSFVTHEPKIKTFGTGFMCHREKTLYKLSHGYKIFCRSTLSRITSVRWKFTSMRGLYFTVCDTFVWVLYEGRVGAKFARQCLRLPKVDNEKRYVAHVEKYLFMLSDALFNVADKRQTQERSS